MTRARRLGAGLLALLVLLLGALAFAWFWRPGLERYAAHLAPPAPASGLRARWFGVTAVVIEDGEHALFIDPFFTRPPGWLPLLRNAAIAPDEDAIRRGLAEAGLARLDAVLVSHSHYDHAMDAGVVARLTGARLYGSASTAQIGRGSGLPEARITTITPQPEGAPLSIGAFRVRFIQSRHGGATGGRPTGEITAPLQPPARYLDYRQGGSYSILVEHPQGRVLHHGSAGFVPGALDGVRADVVLLGIALVEDLPAYLAAVVDPVGARRVVPTHWDDFSRPLVEPLAPLPVGVRLDRFFDETARLRPALQVQTLRVGQVLSLASAPP